MIGDFATGCSSRKMCPTVSDTHKLKLMQKILNYWPTVFIFDRIGGLECALTLFSNTELQAGFTCVML
ncbi:hypothetical protein AYI70_g10329 [Smittium culicis]|uniref:Uncharacterized protein n=1 Tax=Smittium culicis TaxID=133412 RepID=A0A1R1X748_9FUNG|nr:hypothetical protein AYI70_g10329 [Smittium culicis]